MEHHVLSLLWQILAIMLLWELPLAKRDDNVVVPSCPPEATICEFRFTVKHNLTMMKWDMSLDDDQPDVMIPVFVAENGTLYAKRKDCSGQDALTENDFDTLLSGDGSHKRVLAINQKLPGSPIVVYKGQVVSILVTNGMENELMTLHWHGLHMRGTPWMDGAGTVSQCPITPRQTFHYRFKADPVGTHWYHGHIGFQRTMGMAGHVTVLDKSPQEENLRRVNDPVPHIDASFHMMVTEWVSEPTSLYMSRITIGTEFFGGFDIEKPVFPTKLPDGSPAHWMPYESVLINGKGQKYYKETGKSESPTLPLETFRVKTGGNFRFRLVNSGFHMSFSISIDDHPLNVMATDGSDIKTMRVNHLIIHAGETYDFWINATDPKLAGNYWIRVDTLEVKLSDKPFPGHGKAILRYDHAAEILPETKRRNCTLQNCTHLNCPYKNLSPGEPGQCIPVTELRSSVPAPTLKPSDGKTFTELMLANNIDPVTNINGRRFVPYSVPPQTYNKGKRDVLCSNETCHAQDLCHCTHELAVEKDAVVQLVFYSHVIHFPWGSSNHPIHLHGNKFQVVKIGWPIYNSTTGTLKKNSPDIICDDSSGTCKNPRWADPSWSDGGLPVITDNPVIKDTVIVPAGGYTVVRFKADNPGYWLIHCHMATHSEEGMMVTLKVGEVSEMPPVPKGFPLCGDFDWTSDEFMSKIAKPQPQPFVGKRQQSEDVCTLSIVEHQKQYQIVTIVLGIYVAFGSLAMLMNTLRVWSNRKGRPRRGLMEEAKSRDFLQESTPLLS